MIKSIVGWFLIAFGLLFGLGVFVKGLSSPSMVIAMLVFAIGPVAGGGLMIRGRVKAKQQALQAQERDLYVRHEKEIIQLAQAHKGRISIPEIVAETSLSTAEADQVMREMTTKGYVDMQVTDSGVIVYEFYEIAHRKPLEE